MPKQMLPATPPRRISSDSARKLTEILSSCSTTRESEKLPRKVIRWSVAMDPVTAICTPQNLPPVRVARGGDRTHEGPDHHTRCPGPVAALGQLKLSPQAQELPAF